MIKKKWALLTLSAVPLALAGCDSENLDGMQEAAVEIQSITDAAVEDINQLAETETQLQDQFSETLETDEELATLRDESSPVFLNITQREEILSGLEGIENELESQQEILASYEGESLDPEQIEQADAVVDDFESSLSTYITAYSKSIASEREFFAGIAEEDASYEEFSSGIEAINSDREKLREPLLNLDSVLVDLDARINELKTSIEEQLSEEE